MTNYEIERNKLIPIAEKYADEVAGPKPFASSKHHQKDEEIEKWSAKWNKAFHSKMNELWDEKKNNQEGAAANSEQANEGINDLPSQQAKAA